MTTAVRSEAVSNAMQPVNHRCLSGKHCVSRTPDGPAVTAKPDTLCSGCITALQQCLDELPHLREALKVFMGGSMSVAYTSRVNSTPTPQTPMNVAVYDLMDEIGDVLDRTGGLRIDTLIRAPGMEFRVWRRGKPVTAVLSGVERALAVRRVHSKADNLIGFNRVWQRRAAPCPSCRLPTLGTWIGSDTVTCTNENCNSSFTRNDYDLHCLTESKK